jgi:hypothetical protein
MDTPPALRAREEEKHNPAAALAVICAGYFMVILDATVMSLYFQDVRGYSALQAGLALLPEAGLLTIASTASGPVLSAELAPGTAVAFRTGLGG